NSAADAVCGRSGVGVRPSADQLDPARHPDPHAPERPICPRYLYDLKRSGALKAKDASTLLPPRWAALLYANVAKVCRKRSVYHSVNLIAGYCIANILK